MSPRRAVLAVGLAILAVVAVVAVLAAVGRPQIVVLARPAGASLALVRTAGDDLLARHGVAVREAPVCALTPATNPTAVTCTGTTTAAAPILVEAPVSAPANQPLLVTVIVGGQLVAFAPAEAVVDAAGSAA